MNTSIKVLGFLCAAILLLHGNVHAATKNVVYINGIQNTIEDAAESLAVLQDRLAKSTNRVAGKKAVFSVTGIWNPIGWNGTTDGSHLSQDKMELFLEKTAEEKFSQDFQRILAPYNQSREIDKAAAARVAAYLDDMTPGGNSLEADGKITDANMASSQQAVRNLVAQVLSRQPAVVVAHSQGNLLANLAYAKIAADYGNDVYKIVRVINVANTSAFSVSGLSLTHAKDDALFSAAFGLETLPSQGSNWNRTTPRCSNSACNFLLAGATFGGVSGTGGFLDHAFVDTYLSSVNLPVVLNDQGLSFTQGATRFVDRFEDLLYAAAESLDLFYQSKWSQSTSFPSLPDRRGVVSFSIADTGYIAIPAAFSPALRELWAFNPVTKTWARRNNHPGFIDRVPYFVLGSHAFVINENAVWRYTPSSDQWTRMKDKPGPSMRGGFAFSVDGVGYVGGGFYAGAQLWQYKPDSDEWARKNDHPHLAYVQYNDPSLHSVEGISFTIGHKAYVTGTNHFFWEYSPDSDSWMKKAFISAVYGQAFASDSKGYVFNAQGDINSYDVASDRWTQLGKIPGQTVCYPAGFSIGSALFVGVGGRFQANTCNLDVVTDWWRFGP